jgi:hypothetical protein
MECLLARGWGLIQQARRYVGRSLGRQELFLNGVMTSSALCLALLHLARSAMSTASHRLLGQLLSSSRARVGIFLLYLRSRVRNW